LKATIPFVFSGLRIDTGNVATNHVTGVSGELAREALAPPTRQSGNGEGAGNVVADPGFTNPNYPADDFTFSNPTTAARIGFVVFDVNAVRRTSRAIVPPTVPRRFPSRC